MLEALGAAEKIGVEVNPHAREEARGRGLDVRAGLDEVERHWADVVVSNHALEHTLHPFGVLSELHEVLRPGGLLALVLPIDDWRTSRRATGPDRHGHLFTWTPLLMHNLLGEVGFVEVRTAIRTRAWPPGIDLLGRHTRLLGAACWVWSVARRRRELVVTARRQAT